VSCPRGSQSRFWPEVIDNEYYKQTDGLAMGAPTSAIIAETYMQYMEHTQIYPILVKQQIVAYFRYVDDILIIYDEKKQI
jgi:hypothetical protein